MVDFRFLYMFDYQRVGLRTHREFTRHPRLHFGNKPAKIHQTNYNFKSYCCAKYVHIFDLVPLVQLLTCIPVLL